MLSQLPDDANIIGYKLTKPFHYEPVFKSISEDFIGTSADFIKTGKGYYYLQVDKYTRRVL